MINLTAFDDLWSSTLAAESSSKNITFDSEIDI